MFWGFIKLTLADVSTPVEPTKSTEAANPEDENPEDNDAYDEEDPQNDDYLAEEEEEEEDDRRKSSDSSSDSDSDSDSSDSDEKKKRKRRSKGKALRTLKLSIWGSKPSRAQLGDKLTPRGGFRIFRGGHESSCWHFGTSLTTMRRPGGDLQGRLCNNRPNLFRFPVSFR